MEPKALANLNGQVIASPPSHSSSSHSKSAPSTPVPKTTRRRESGLWQRTPEDQQPSTDSAHDFDDKENSLILTPVPKTPAPAQIAAYIETISTPTSTITDSSLDEDEEDGRREMLTRTCPPKSTSTYSVLGEGILKREKDEGVLMRLMAARRKSLQFAPKVGSPLARAPWGV
jgi:hypothetical protein